MGLVGVQENGNGDLISEIPLGTKTKYTRMTSEAEEEEEDGLSTKKKQDTKTYIIACAIFASLNSVLLGYGR